MRNILSFLLPVKTALPSGPNAIIDFIFDNGLFHISIKNIGNESAFKISVEFSEAIFGIEGTKEISILPLFQNIEFLPPQKEILTFLDTSASYFKRREPTKISTKISYQNSKGGRYCVIINHDLEIYKEIGYIKRVENRQDLIDQNKKR